jgi:Domain of unknown function (DUF4157)
MKASRRFLNRPIQTHQSDSAEPFFAPTQKQGAQADHEDNFFAPSVSAAPNGSVQTKLSVNAPGDKHEQEADAMANQVVQRMSAPEEEKDKIHKKGKPEEEDKKVQRMSAPEEDKDKIHKKGKPEEEDKKVQRMSAPEEDKDKIHKKGKPEEEDKKVQRMSAPEEDKDKSHKKGKPEEEEKVQRKCAECEEEEHGQVQRKSDGSGTAPSGVTQQIESSKGRGSKLSDATRSQMESSFGTDFSNVTIHTNRESADMNNALHAQAFTHGSDIYFNEGKYNPQNTEGGRLLAHELTHVVQQENKSSKNKVQRYPKVGFDVARAKQIESAVAKAIIGVLECEELSTIAKYLIIDKLASAIYKFDPDADECAWTFPTSPIIWVGEGAFDKNRCCDLASTLAHEAGHAGRLYFEGGARDMECDCFKCGC